MSIKLNQGIPNWFVDEFYDDLYHVCQQKESKFRQAVKVVPGLTAAEDRAFDMMDAFTLQEKEGRNPDTPTLDPSTQRRWVTTTPYHQSVLYDKDDDLSIKLAPTGEFVTAFKRAINRQFDQVIFNAFEGTVYSGRRRGSTITWSSQNGNTKYTGKDTGRTIAHDCSSGNCNAADTGMTTEKIELALEYFSYNNVSEDIPKWCAISPRQATNLFGQEEYVNIDYNGDKPLTTGKIIRNWMGFNWIVTDLIETGSNNDVDADTNVCECWAWAQDGILLAIADELTLRITEESTLSYGQRVYAKINIGAMRFDEDKVIKIECVE